MNKLFPFQEQDVEIMLKRKHNLMAHEPGLGKTVMAIEMVNRLRLRHVLIVCPASTKRHWARMLEQWLESPRVIQIVDKKTDFITDLAEIIIVNYDLISHSYLLLQLKKIKWDILICDEAHRLKNMKAKRTTAVLSREGVVRSSVRTLMITGTPVLNRPIELYPMLKVLSPQTIEPYSDYFRYAKHFCNGYMDNFSFNDRGASNTKELNTRLRQHYMVRRLTKEVEIELPEKRFEIIFLDSTKEIQNQLRTVLDAERTDFKHQSLSAKAGELATLRQETAKSKLVASSEYIRTCVESTNKIVLFCYHHSIIEQIKILLSEFNPVCLHGGCSQTERENAIKTFKTDPTCKVFIGQIQAAGEGIDGLQDACNNVLFIEWSWVPGEIEQACKRVHRIGQTHPVLIRFLVWADSVEEHMMRVALDKVKIIKEIMK